MAVGSHLLVDCQGISRDICLNDELMLDVLCRAAKQAGAHVISQVRYRFVPPSPSGFTAICLLDESHCSAHTYADEGMMAIDIFTCGGVNPLHVLSFVQEEIDLNNPSIRQISRFEYQDMPRVGLARGNGSIMDTSFLSTQAS